MIPFSAWKFGNQDQRNIDPPWEELLKFPCSEAISDFHWEVIICKFNCCVRVQLSVASPTFGWGLGRVNWANIVVLMRELKRGEEHDGKAKGNDWSESGDPSFYQNPGHRNWSQSPWFIFSPIKWKEWIMELVPLFISPLLSHRVTCIDRSSKKGLGREGE